MTKEDLNHRALSRAWVKQAQLDAERGVVYCRKCRHSVSADEAVTLWRGSTLAFALCDDCAAGNDVFMRPTEKGFEVRALPRMPLIVRNSR